MIVTVEYGAGKTIEIECGLPAPQVIRNALDLVPDDDVVQAIEIRDGETSRLE